MSATVVALRPQAEAFAEQTGRMDTLATLERASALLQEVRTIQDAKQIHDVAKAARVYAKEQRLGREVMAKARAVACEALRRIGELLNETERNIGTRGQLVGPGIIGPSQSEGPIETPLTLAELGIDYKTSSIAQKLFALPRASKTSATAARRLLRLMPPRSVPPTSGRPSTLLTGVAPPTPPRFASAPAPNCSPPRAGDA